MKLFKMHALIGPMLLCQMAYAALTPKMLANNKELVSEIVSQKSMQKLIKRINDPFYMRSMDAIYESALADFNSNKMACDIGLVKAIEYRLSASNLGISTKEFLELLRYHDRIDDILLKMSLRTLEVSQDIDNSADDMIPFNLRNNDELKKKYDFKSLYSEFNQFPNDRDVCSMGAWFRVMSKVGEDSTLLRRMNLTALELGVITKENFKKIEILREAELPSWDFFLVKYLDIVMYAKDKQVTRPTLGMPTNYAQESIKVARWKHLSRREALYKKYNSSQIYMLGDTMVTMSKRLLAKKVRIVFDYDTPTPEEENYVVDGQTQYCLCLSLLAKDLMKVNTETNFQGKGVTYDDMVMASIETGAVNFEELEVVIGFEGFWNFKQPAWKTWTTFLMQFTSTASYFLPTPYNVVGAIGLAVISNKINQLGPKQECSYTRI